MPEIIFNGPEGRLEGRYHHNENKGAPIAVVLHPHPLYGGTMNNKIVYRIYQAFVNNGFSTMRFNFRGVGKSLGKFDDGIGELADAATALDWIQQMNPNASTCWIGGFSFGAWVAMQLLMRRPEIEGFVAVSPPANMYDFSFLSPCPAPGLFCQGKKDDIVKEDDVRKLVDKIKGQKYASIAYESFDNADHYFRAAQEELDQTLNSYIADRIFQQDEARMARQDRKRRHLPRE